MSMLESTWSMEHGSAHFIFPEAMSAADIDDLEAVCALCFRGMRRRRVDLDRKRDAGIEYDSWFIDERSGPPKTPEPNEQEASAGIPLDASGDQTARSG